MMHSGSMDFETTVKSMTLFAKEVMPRIEALGTAGTAGTALKDLATTGSRARGKKNAAAA